GLLSLIAALGLVPWGMVPAQAAPFAYIPLTIDNDFECTLPTASAVAIIDTTTNMVVAMVPVPPCPSGVAVHPAGTFVYIAGPYGLSVIATATNSVVATMLAEGPSISVAVHPAGTFFYVTGSFFTGYAVFVMHTSTNTVVATVPVGF